MIGSSWIHLVIGFLTLCHKCELISSLILSLISILSLRWFSSPSSQMSREQTKDNSEMTNCIFTKKTKQIRCTSSKQLSQTTDEMPSPCGKDVLAVLFPPSPWDSKQERFHKGVESIICKRFAQHICKICFTLNVHKVDNATSNCFANLMVSTCMVFLFQD